MAGDTTTSITAICTTGILIMAIPMAGITMAATMAIMAATESTDQVLAEGRLAAAPRLSATALPPLCHFLAGGANTTGLDKSTGVPHMGRT